MPDAKRPDQRRRGPAPRPGKPGAARSRAVPRRIEPRPAEPGQDGAESVEPVAESVAESIRKAAAESLDTQSEQRFGSAARRAAILAVVVCVLTLTIAGPVRTYFAQRAEMNQLKAAETQLRSQIEDLEQQKVKLADPVFIAAQARERLGFVMPGDIPYQVQLPPSAAQPVAPGVEGAPVKSDDPWYTALWHTIADAPHDLSPVMTPPPGAPPGPDAPPPGPPPAGG
ncbi:septum formation initiator [Mycolicibacterium canariasense]|uniref:Septum formation initiator n=1 Tax=Mycolicibacterium canariasense TaxID=228230 RepID=A0A117I8P1_MYCCR|nr:septum formation initiator family protein [Mycolicibacterium canariasense]MCV7211987.1 septum formation initiator family protein [Mycolicibacterium canariasense]ORV04085.1 septum formation initiator [Mycolicibacterium canariasense]GAS93497.1 septum formation initiator [Mycolicibacterium canariasense]